MNDLNITRLMEMGFSREDAMGALNQANNDLEKAISYLFGDIHSTDVPEQSVNDQQQLIKYEDTINISNPQDIPNFSELQSSSHDVQQDKGHGLPPPVPPKDNHNQNHNQPDQDAYTATLFNRKQFLENIHKGSAETFDVQSGGMELSDEDDDGSIYDKVANYTRIKSFPPVVLTQRSNYLENHIIPLLVILSQYDKFKSIFLTPEKTNYDYGYSDNWFKHDSDLYGNESKPAFIIELQRMLAFLLPQYSKRSYMSGQLFLRNLPNDLQYDIEHDRIDDLEDLIKKFYYVLHDNTFKEFPNDNISINSLVESTIESLSEKAKNDITVIPIDFESRSLNLFDTLTSLFWSDDETDEDSVGNVQFVNIAPVLTFQLNGDDDGFRVQPFRIDEYFYPEIFSNKYVSVIKEMSTKKRQLIKQRNSITQSIMNFNSFEGKPIKKIMNQSLEFLKGIDQKETDVETKNMIQDVGDLISNIQVKTTNLTNGLHELGAKNLEYDIKNYDNILNYINKHGNEEDRSLPPPKRYALTGIIASDVEYFYKIPSVKSGDNNDNDNIADWVHVTCFTTTDKKVVDFNIDYIQFSIVEDAIIEFTKDSRRQFIFIYIEEDSFNEKEEIEISNELKQFFATDNEVIEKLIKASRIYDESSDEETEDVNKENVPEQEDSHKEQETQEKQQSDQENDEQIEDVNLIDI
ncbi:uncharacterized protein RJT21DRAFT_123147 [Scheffersomyces amazonensis]|uniref:uncharacterized protein n=1 Tax=Scheffersomyces amazonensis TaxID=1078765 RepID=UPI00315D762B